MQDHAEKWTTPLTNLLGWFAQEVETFSSCAGPKVFSNAHVTRQTAGPLATGRTNRFSYMLLWYFGPKIRSSGQLKTCHEASWRYGPCRTQDPMMIETYRRGLCTLIYCKYHRLGLLIYSLKPQILVNMWSSLGQLTLSHCCNDHGI